MTPLPIIRFEVERLHHSLLVALSEHSAKVDADMRAAVDEFCKPENISKVIDKAAREAMECAIKSEVQNFFNFGPGRQVIAAAVKEKLMARESYTPLDEVGL